jgi:hypothetical protein
MLTRGALQRINNRPRSVSRLPILAVGGGSVVLAALLYVLEVSPTFAPLAVLLAGVLSIFGVYRIEKARTITYLSYEGNLDEDTASRFSRIQEALERLASSKKIWRLSAKAGELSKSEDVLPTPEREPMRVGLLETPGIRSDVPIWGIEAGEEERIFFFPEGILHYKNGSYEPLPYRLFDMDFSSARFLEEEKPDDAEIAGHTWRYARKDGTPDPRYAAHNREIPIVLYGVLQIRVPSGLDLRLLVSNVGAASLFAEHLGAVKTERAAYEGHRRDAPSGASSGRDEWDVAAVVEWKARLESARRVLGVRKGASENEIAAAYRKMARTYHPDKVAHRAPQDRVAAEERMKEINAAYSELKRRHIS